MGQWRLLSLEAEDAKNLVGSPLKLPRKAVPAALSTAAGTRLLMRGKSSLAAST